jgi:putative ABC transport system permease protein
MHMPETLAGDLRYALRRLLQRPAFAISTLLTLGIGIGTTSAVVSLAKVAFLDSLPFPRGDHLAVLWQTRMDAAQARERLSPANFLDVRDRVKALTSLAAAEPTGVEFLGGDEPLNLPAWRVSEGFFELLSIQPLYGRLFSPQEYLPGNGNVVVLNHRLWRDVFGGDPAAVGSTITLNGQPHVVVGVMNRGFNFPSPRDVWLPRPFAEADRQRRSATYLSVFALVAPGSTLAQAGSELQTVGTQLAQGYPAANSGLGLTASPLREYMFGSVRPLLLALAAGVACVLLIACANVASLLVGQGLARRRELAVRSALGAGRGRLFRQLVIESATLSILGGVVGAVIAYAIVHALGMVWPEELHNLRDIALSWPVTIIVALVLGVTVLVFSVLPAYRLSSLESVESLREGTTSRAWTSRGIWPVVVASEVAFALALVIGATLLSASLINLLRVNLGFSPHNVAALQVFVWRIYTTDEQRANFFEAALQNLRGLPDVRAAAAVSALPFSEESSGTDASFTIPGELPPGGVEPTARALVVTPDYFRAMQVKQLEGRPFEAADTADGAPVAIVSESFAQRHLRGRSAVGARVMVKFGKPVPREVVGVVDDVRTSRVDLAPEPSIYIPHRQYPIGSMAFVVRTDRDVARSIPSIKEAIWRVNKALPFRMVSTLDALLQTSLADRRFAMTVLASFAGFALLVMWIGLLAIVNYWVIQRTREIAIRVALGADRGAILRWVVGQGMAIVMVGIVLGTLVASVLARFLASSLFGVQPIEPSIFVSVVALIVLTAAAASYVPARRGARLEPSRVLRAE